MVMLMMPLKGDVVEDKLHTIVVLIDNSRCTYPHIPGADD
jgi:hypothetical protein